MTIMNIKTELENLKKDFSELMDLFDNSHANVSLISEKYSEIKVRVNERLIFLEKEEKSNTLNRYEICFLLPAIREVSLHCTARIGSQNIEQLSSSIYDGEDYCSYWLTELDA
ncbi:hypothetical protein [Aeromonas sobria]|uniref:hypothetical protein n=1 Tax=Aeromonas sobria TaxID=646 RepID=UPI0011198EB4|nr:hypothetical protein [Aeromonas sobria]TNH91683.1 hypothetical protein CF137_20915 [Aeromonas sobria]HEH9439785.1 hypothetical protein [Aeromonas sobria]